MNFFYSLPLPGVPGKGVDRRMRKMAGRVLEQGYQGSALIRGLLTERDSSERYFIDPEIRVTPGAYGGASDVPPYTAAVFRIFPAEYLLQMTLFRKDDGMVDANHERSQQDNDRVYGGEG